MVMRMRFFFIMVMRIAGGNVLNYNENNNLSFYIFMSISNVTFIMRFPHVNVNVEKERKHIEGLNTIYYKLK